MPMPAPRSPVTTAAAVTVLSVTMPVVSAVGSYAWAPANPLSRVRTATQANDTPAPIFLGMLFIINSPPLPLSEFQALIANAHP